VIWNIDPVNKTMHQGPESRSYLLPEPKVRIPDTLAEILEALQIPIPTVKDFTWAILPVDSSKEPAKIKIETSKMAPSFSAFSNFPPLEELHTRPSYQPTDLDNQLMFNVRTSDLVHRNLLTSQIVICSLHRV
jgi:hypothetical protein